MNHISALGYGTPMHKLHFRYGVMGSAKTLNLLSVAHNYEDQGKNVIVVKPSIDTRLDGATIGSRTGLSRVADIVVDPTHRLDLLIISRLAHQDKVSCVLVDECQFLTASQVDDLRYVANHYGVTVICYGLKTDYMSRLFEGSKRLLEVADSILELKTVCKYCDNKAIMNHKVCTLLTVAKVSGCSSQIEIGGDDIYIPLCAKCYFDHEDNQDNQDKV